MIVERKERYINPYTDFGFKKLFGTEANSETRKSVLCGFPAGHGDVNLPLVMGAPVTIDVRANGATLQFDIEGTQQEFSIADMMTDVPTSAAVRMQLAGKRE